MNFSMIVDGSAPVQLLDRVTPPDPVGGSNATNDAAVDYAYWQMGLGEQYHDYLDNVINTHTALTYSAVWACVRWISQTIASLGWHVFEKQDRGREQIDIADPTAWILDMQANPETSAFEWKQCMMNHALTDGNGYSENERDGFGRLHWTWQLGRGRVCPDRTSSGQLVYEVTNGSGVKNTVLDPSQVFHLKGLGDDGIVGYSVIAMARKTIKVARNQQRFGDDFFGRGPTPGGIFMSKAKLQPQAEKEARESFDRLYSGRKNVGRVIRITGDATFTPLSLPNDDAQFLESQRFSIEEIARIYGVPLHKIQSMDAATNNNIEQQAIEAVQDCLMPWCRRLESEADVKYFGRVNRGRRFTRLNLGTLMRGDTASQTQSLQQQVNAGIRTPNEARELLDMNPQPDGDELLVQGAMTTMARAVAGETKVITNPATPEPDESGNPPADPGADPSADPAAVAAAFTPIFADAYKKFVGFEADKAKQAARKGNLTAHLAKQYGSPESLAYVGATLQPIFAAFLMASGRSGDAKALADGAAERHHQHSKRLLAAGKVPDGFGDRALEIAAELKIAWESTT